MPTWNRTQIDALILVTVNATVPAVLVWKTHSGEITPTVALVVALSCLVGLNAAALAAIRRRNRRVGQRTSRQIVLAASGMAVLAALVMGAAVFTVRRHNDYLDLALSDTPLSSIYPEQKRLVLKLIRRRAVNSRDYDRLLAEEKKMPLCPSLYTPESFANEEVIHSTIARLTEMADADFQYFQKQQKAMAEFRDQMARADATYLRSSDIEQQEQEAMEQSTNSLEHDWLDSATALYGYAAVHSKEISLRNGDLHFETDTVQSEFSDLEGKSRVLHQRLQEGVQKLARLQEQAHAKAGAP